MSRRLTIRRDLADQTDRQGLSDLRHTRSPQGAEGSGQLDGLARDCRRRPQDRDRRSHADSNPVPRVLHKSSITNSAAGSRDRRFAGRSKEASLSVRRGFAVGPMWLRCRSNGASLSVQRFDRRCTDLIRGPTRVSSAWTDAVSPLGPARVSLLDRLASVGLDRQASERLDRQASGRSDRQSSES